MKNLDLINISFKDFKINSEDSLSICHGQDETTGFGELYVCTHNLNVTNISHNGEYKWDVDLSKVASAVNDPVNLTYLTLPGTLCVGLANGELFTIGDSGNQCDLAGKCDDGLLAMEWSPDQELLVLVTKKLNAILMTCTFDPIGEVNLLSQEFGDSKFITVGWGKKETQFHGSEGKQAARIKTEINADPETDLDNTVKISWRGDGNLYAIGFAMDGIRRFKVFDREGELQYSNEKHQGLESNLAWRPSGNLIATTQKLPDKHLVSFFEKNGLKHGEINIPINVSTIIEDVSWSSDSEILTVQCRDTETNTQQLLLFTSSNYHWYLKQSLLFKPDQKVTKIMWIDDFDVANNKKLHIVFNNGQYYTYTWIWNVDHSRGCSEEDDAICAVIDGNKLLVTGFRQTVVPPPMAALEIETDSFINSVHFAPSQTDLNPNSFCICNADGKLLFYDQTSKFPLEYKVVNTVEFEKYDFPFQYYNMHWVKSDIVIGITPSQDNGYSLCEFTVESNILKLVNTTILPGAVIRIISHPIDSSNIFLQLNSGDIIQYTLEGDIQPHDVSFNTPCSNFHVVSIGDNTHFIGLSHKGNLYIDDKMAINNVSSFYVHTHFLLITTLQHVMLCVELSSSGLNAIMEYQANGSESVYSRKIERGAKLVIAVPNDTRTVFQMPRGNLEAIQPRPLSLKIIGQHLDCLRYHEAFDLMRKQRINLNLIYDHDPDKFENNIDTFLEAIDNNSWLNLFLSDLENSDVTKTMYSSSYAGRNNSLMSIETKILRICDILREHLSKRTDYERKILPILTTHVKKNSTEDLEKALVIIKDLKLKESKGSKLLVGSDEALKYLLYMVDVTHLFDVALGMYDFDLVLLVATKSQKDPKEYIPMLNELNEMDENYKRFTINKHLKRFNRAVECLVKCGLQRHDELKTFVKYHSLYREALQLFSPAEDIYKEISDDFAQFLKLKKQFVEAGIIYERSNYNHKAIECYKDASEWELAIKLAQSWPQEQYKELCLELVNTLKEEKRHRESLIILEQFYEDNGDEAIAYATDCGQYKTALRLIVKYDKHDKREALLEALLADFTNLKELIDTNQANFTRHRDRLRVVRENKKVSPVEYDSFANKDCDLYSDAGSTLASSSRGSSSRSHRSSKNRRKHERKVASLKEGSPYEDVALVIALHTLVTSSFDMRLQVKEIITALSCCSRDKEAFILQVSLEKLLKEMRDSLRDIWTNEFVLEATNASIAALNVPEGHSIIPQGIASLEPHIRFAPVIQELKWTLEGLY